MRNAGLEGGGGYDRRGDRSLGVLGIRERRVRVLGGRLISERLQGRDQLKSDMTLERRAAFPAAEVG